MGRILQRDILIITVSESNTMGPPLPRVSEFAREVLPPRSPAEGLALEAAHKLAREEGCGAVVVDDLATVRVSGSSVKVLCGETLRKKRTAGGGHVCAKERQSIIELIYLFAAEGRICLEAEWFCKYKVFEKDAFKKGSDHRAYDLPQYKEGCCQSTSGGSSSAIDKYNPG